MSTILRRARLVDLDTPDADGDGSAAAPRTVASPGTVDLRLLDGLIETVAPSIEPGPWDDVVDLDGRWVIPGLWDAHTHMTQWALARRRLDVSAATSAAEVVRVVVERLRTDPPPAGTMLVAAGFRDGLWPDAPTAALLDTAIAAEGLPPTPVVVIAGDLHCAWLSTAGLARLGASGHPTGLLREAEWMPLMGSVDDVAVDVLDRWVGEAASAAAARGVVGVVDVELDENLTAWRRRVAGGIDTLRVGVGVWREHLDRAIHEGLATGDVLTGTGGLLTMGPLKVITDGSLNTRTAFCHDPYPGLTGEGAFGVLSVGPDELEPLMGLAHRHGIECAIHAIGDHANTMTLDAFEATGARGSIEHAQLLLDADVPRFAALGVVASVQPEHAMDDRDVADRYWAGRTGRAFVLRSLHDAGVRLAFGSDAPVAPLDPWLAISAAVARTRDDRPAWHGEQALPTRVALASSVRSRVAAGQVADLAVLDADPLALADLALRTAPVAGTLLGGRWTHRTW